MLQRVKFIHSEIIIKLDQIASISVQKEFNAPSQKQPKMIHAHVKIGQNEDPEKNNMNV